MNLFTRDPFDIATAARRPTRAAWWLLALALVFAAVSAALLQRSLVAVHRAQQAIDEQQAAERARSRSSAAARAQAQDPAMLERLRAQQELQRTLRMSWTGLFAALEQAARSVDGRVSVTSLAPAKTTSDGAEVGIVGIASAHDALMDYVEALQNDRHVKEVTLSGQQLSQNAGMTVTRFHLSLVWNPRMESR